ANDFLGDEVKSWIDRMQNAWNEVNFGNWYSLGVFTSAGAGRWSVSHNGLLNSRGKNPAGKPITAIVTSFAYRPADGTSVFVAVTPAQRRASPAMSAIRQDLDRAHRAVTKLP